MNYSKVHLLLLDLDGTVRETQSGKTFINEPTDQQLIAGVAEAIAALPSHIRIVGITNQGGVQAGFKTIENAIEEQKITLSLLPRMDSIYFCPDDGHNVYWVNRRFVDINRTGLHPEGKSHQELWDRVRGKLRKPGEGMLVLAMDWYETYGTDCLYIGDRPEDEQAALSAGIPFMWADEWRVGFVR